MIEARSAYIALVGSFFLFASPFHLTAQGKTLEISGQNAQLLEKIGDHPDLEVLLISCLEDLQSLPDSIGKLTKLKELNIDNGNGCSMNPILPEAIGNLHSLQKLVLYGAQDPRTIAEASQPLQRHKFPKSMSRLKNLTYLDLGRNGYRQIPSFVKDLPNLKELRFEFNDLDDLPDFLNTLPKLTRITLGNNCRITANDAKMRDLKRRFPRVKFGFEGEYDCPGKK
jgi:Leucine-rich repeat (LRR) protein